MARGKRLGKKPRLSPKQFDARAMRADVAVLAEATQGLLVALSTTKVPYPPVVIEGLTALVACFGPALRGGK
jgi:hypothetical protein